MSARREGFLDRPAPLVTGAYAEALRFLYGRIDYERLAAVPYRKNSFKLGRMRELLARLGNPHKGMPIVHVAGTKGKGSTAAMIAVVLTSAGYRTGLFTSPHLYRLEERMQIDGRCPSDEATVALVGRLRPHVEAMDAAEGRSGGSVPSVAGGGLGGGGGNGGGQSCAGPTYFEITTAMALELFRQERVDIAVLEVGLGGRLDSTNVCHPQVAVITSISRDHMRQLGWDLAKIAAEKAGIVKPGVPTISGVGSGEARDAIAAVCRARRSHLRELGTDFGYEVRDWRDASSRLSTPDSRLPISPSMGAGWSEGAADGPRSVSNLIDVYTWRRSFPALELPLLGEHQAANCAVALAALEVLAERGWDVAEGAVRWGLARLVWPARIEVVRENPTVVIDAAHNWASVKALLATLDQTLPRGRYARRMLVFAGTHDKDLRGMLWQLLPRFETVVFTRYLNNPRAVPPEDLAGLAAQLADAPVHIAPTPAAAWSLAQRLAGRDDVVVVTGSFFLAAEMREQIVEERQNRRPLDASQRSPVSNRYLSTDGSR